jgi:ribosomal protein S18 acetylase RimI-like enzyme
MKRLDVSIRYGGMRDAKAIVAFNRALALETEHADLNERTLSAGVDHMLRNPSLGFYVVAVSEGNPVGCLMITSEWSDWRNGLFWWVQSVYVRPELRRRGVYRRMYDFVKNEAGRKPQICGFRLYVIHSNRVAQTTYQRSGMSETGYRIYEELIGSK